MSIQGGGLLKSHHGMASGDIALAPVVRPPADLCSLARQPLSAGGTQDSVSAGQLLPASTETSEETHPSLSLCIAATAAKTTLLWKGVPICQGTAKGGPCRGEIGTEREESERDQGECLKGSLLTSDIYAELAQETFPGAYSHPTEVGWLSLEAVWRLEAMTGFQAAPLPLLGEAWPFPRLPWNARLLLGVEQKCDFPSGVRRLASQAWTSIFEQEPKQTRGTGPVQAQKQAW